MNVKTDLRGRFVTIRDQGSRPTCLAFAVSDTHSAVRGRMETLSSEFIFYHAVNSSHGDPHRAVDFASILEAVRTKGQPAEFYWTYLRKIPTNTSTWKPPAGISQLYRRESIYKPNNVDDLLDRIDHDLPIIIGMTISDSFYLPEAGGIVSSNEPPDPSRRHAVIGLGHATRGNERLVLVRNSWGNAWGINGYAWLNEKYLSPRLLAYAELTRDLTI